MPTTNGTEPNKRVCTLLLFVATPAEEEALEQVLRRRGLAIEDINDPVLGKYRWLGAVGNETVIAIRPAREGGRIVMGALGRLGSSAKGIRFREATGARGIVQLGMAFGVDPRNQHLGDVLVSSSLIPYDNRVVGPANRRLLQRIVCGEGYAVDYSEASRQPARSALVELFLREQRRGGQDFAVHVGAILSGAARVRSRYFRDELVSGVPGGEDPIVGGEMEGVGLLAASTASEEPIWCVVKGISDFADEQRDEAVHRYRSVASRNAAEFVVSALVRDAVVG